MIVATYIHRPYVSERAELLYDPVEDAYLVLVQTRDSIYPVEIEGELGTRANPANKFAAALQKMSQIVENQFGD